MNSRHPIALVYSCAVLLVLMMTSVAAQAASFGRTTAGTIASAGLRADFKRGSSYVLQEQATFQRLCAYLDASGAATGAQSLRMSLYRDQNGAPAEQVVESYPAEFEAGQHPAQWYCFDGPSAPLNPGKYWAMIHSGGDAGVVRYYYDGPANWRGNVDQYSDGSSDTFGTASAGEGTLSIRVDYLTTTETRFAGSRSVGSSVSQPMSANFKRGSSFVLTEKANVNSLNAYIDGLGGVAGEQSLTLALYADKNGEPAERVAHGYVTFATPIAGRSGRWVTATPLQPTSLPAGRYWLALHTGSTAGVLRYYSSGQGNWRGNSNTGVVPSGLFGQANPGNGTISGFILYSPSNFVTGSFGATEPGTIPSSGLTANFMRGSAFNIGGMEANPVIVTALWAYLDGKGGASGSQKVRLVLYSELSHEQDSMLLHAVSDEVTITAGSAPRWVRFPIPYTRVSDTQQLIMIQSSGTAGVVRNYASNGSQRWYGMAANYSAEPPAGLALWNNGSGLPVPQTGNVVVSLYAETYDLFPSE